MSPRFRALGAPISFGRFRIGNEGAGDPTGRLRLRNLDRCCGRRQGLARQVSASWHESPRANDRDRWWGTGGRREIVLGGGADLGRQRDSSGAVLEIGSGSGGGAASVIMSGVNVSDLFGS